MFVYREAVYDKDVPENQKAVTEIIIGKQRNGPIDTIKLAFIADYAKFENLVEYGGVPEGVEAF